MYTLCHTLFLPFNPILSVGQVFTPFVLHIRWAFTPCPPRSGPHALCPPCSRLHTLCPPYRVGVHTLCPPCSRRHTPCPPCSVDFTPSVFCECTSVWRLLSGLRIPRLPASANTGDGEMVACHSAFHKSLDPAAEWSSWAGCWCQALRWVRDGCLCPWQAWGRCWSLCTRPS